MNRPVVGYVPGAWDMFHIGHLNILLRSREQCDRLIVGVVTDDALYAAKNKYPIVPLAERMEVVSHFAMVDDVVVDFSSNKLDVWRRVGFDVLVQGRRLAGHGEGRQARGRHGDGRGECLLLPVHGPHLEHTAQGHAGRAVTPGRQRHTTLWGDELIMKDTTCHARRSSSAQGIPSIGGPGIVAALVARETTNERHA